MIHDANAAIGIAATGGVDLDAAAGNAGFGIA
jgi:hypothetical protein